ncbi:MAG TPA: 16S rRNA (cytosine(967)-C(5))-methyltransferase RsmB [Vicinamibacterales bacterium]|jgi:16S rRNA (cytosine967-C5)-methyltransferase|nr:16S rRNA (cytosine(967)-C(5))-methyltransferase RsmB [Vicinamibacterales bacterium]
MIAPARVAAYDVLRAIDTGRADLPTALAAARASLADDRDRALAADIAAGVQRWRNALDHVIAHAARRPVARLDAEVLAILRLSAYQLLHLTRVPASAVVDDAVKLVKRAAKTSASGFVNGVLRTLSRSRRSLPLPEPPADPADRDAALAYLTITLSHPEWLARRWYDRYGFAAARQWMQFNNEPAPLTLRVNTIRTDPEALVARLHREDVDVEPCAYAPGGFIVRRGQALGTAAFEEGWFIVQDEASQLVGLLAGDRPRGRVLDACASPGGKSTAIAARMEGGVLVASDVRARRIDLLRRTVRTTGASRVRIVQADLLRPLPFSQPFDCVLVDAPCSGTGTLRRDPDIRWRRLEPDLAPLAAAQDVMLRHAAAAVAPGGRLIYATCSSEPEENDAVVDRFLAAHPDFQAVHAGNVAGSLPAAVVDDRGRLRTLPHRHGLEVFFGAVLARA